MRCIGRRTAIVVATGAGARCACANSQMTASPKRAIVTAPRLRTRERFDLLLKPTLLLA